METVKPDLRTTTLSDLMAWYHTRGVSGRPGQPWTPEALLDIGAVWYYTHGAFPVSNNWLKAYSMPDKTVLRRFWRSYYAYCCALAGAVGLPEPPRRKPGRPSPSHKVRR
jgi:hypothetical protein